MVYQANGGQTFLPVNGMPCSYDQWKPVLRPEPPLPELKINPIWEAKGWFMGFPPVQHFLPGVTAEMIDWFWANMEKCYYLWGPGSHKFFQWIKEPWKYGFTESQIAVAENTVENGPIFELCGDPVITMRRFDMDHFIYNYALEHVLMEGLEDPETGEMMNNNVHMFQDVEGGCVHITTNCWNEKYIPFGRTKEDQIREESSLPAGATFSHQDYECSHWPVFLPALYNIWKDHPDPCQNVKMDLSVEQTDKYQWRYIHENGPVI